MTVYKMAQSGAFKDKTILLLDENSKKQMIVPGVSGTYKRELGTRYFKKMGLAFTFANADFKRDLDLEPYQYNMVQGLDFYNQVLSLF
jgi:lycopene beta-cyclase